MIDNLDNYKIDIKHIEQEINKSNIKVISFDIFDTLLVRPVIEPRDIFYLFDKKLKKYNSYTFTQLRFNAEEDMIKSNPNIYDIWNSIAKKNRLSKIDKNFLCEQEIELESDLLYTRKLIKKIFEYAIKSGKKVILTSDMYLTSEILSHILKKNGYKDFKNIYVSNECNRRKSSGDLYKFIVNREEISPSELLHIGDNYYSDYKIANQIGINAIWVPSNVDLFLHDHKFSKKMNLKEITKLSYNNRILLGYTINSLYEENNNAITLVDLSKLVIFPILMSILSLTNQSNFRSKYDKVFLCARDGYLPFEAFKVFNKFKSTLPYEYFLASRQAYSCIIYPTPYSRLKKDSFLDNFTLLDYLNLTILDKKILNLVKSKLSPDELNLSVKSNIEECNNMLRRFDTDISKAYTSRKIATKRYYSKNIFSRKKRIIVFDCGYSGSISIALNKALDSKFNIDKIYLFQTDKNIERDKENKTTTYLLSRENRHEGWIDELLETMLSPLVGSCRGFFIDKANKVRPIFEKAKFSSEMKKDHDLVQNTSLQEIERFILLFKGYWDYFDGFDISFNIKCLNIIFSKRPKNTEIFSNFQFTDTYLTDNVITLKEIIDKETLNDTLFNKVLLKIISWVKYGIRYFSRK